MNLKQQNAVRYVTGFATGAAIGAIAAILLAPRTGRETRELLSEKAHELKDKTKDVFQRGKSTIGEAAVS
jgi:gas vesicle protein